MMTNRTLPKTDGPRKTYVLATNNAQIKEEVSKDRPKIPIASPVVPPEVPTPARRLTLKDLRSQMNLGKTLESFGYQKGDLIAEGGYGSVSKGYDFNNRRHVALKYMKHGDDNSISQATLREVGLLRGAGVHENIVQMLDWLFLPSFTVMVMELFESDLSTFIKKVHKEQQFMPPRILKTIMRGILAGTDHLHCRGIAHRDLKPRNVLVSGDLIPKIADFGLSKFITFPVRQITENFGTRWYRAPEVLFQCKTTTMRVDMWSIGTIFAEMKEGVAIFPGRDTEDQIQLIFKTLGSPTEETWPDHYETLVRYGMTGLPFNLPSRVPRMDQEELDILMKFLQYQSCRRISAEAALKLPYFNFFDPDNSLPVISQPVYNAAA